MFTSFKNEVVTEHYVLTCFPNVIFATKFSKTLGRYRHSEIQLLFEINR